MSSKRTVMVVPRGRGRADTRRKTSTRGKGLRLTEIVQVKVGGQKKKKGKKRIGGVAFSRGSGFRKPTLTAAMAQEHWSLALIDPFNADASEARIPGPYRVPTATTRFRGTYTITTTGSGTFNCAFFPSPFLSLYPGSAGTFTSGQTNTYPGGGFFNSQPNEFGLFASSFRIVSCGWKIRNLQPPTTCTGRLFVGRVPMCGLLPGPNILGTINPTLNYILGSSCGLTGNVYPGPFLVELRDSYEGMADQLITDSLILRHEPCSPAFMNWRNAGNNVLLNGADAFAAGEVTTNATGVPLAYDSFFSEDYTGWDCWMMYGEGFPAGAVLDVEQALHLEYVPNVVTAGSTGVAQAAATIGAAVSPGTGETNEKTLSRLQEVPLYSLISEGIERGARYAGKQILSALMAKVGYEM